MKQGFDLSLSTVGNPSNSKNKGNSGELFLANQDLSLTNSLSQQAYLCMFGGNVESETTGNEIESQTRKDWWGNSLLLDSSTKYFNSKTEKTLNNVVKNSFGRNKIIEAAKSDLSVLSDVCVFTVDVEMTMHNVKINVSLTKKGDSEEKRMQVIWDELSKETVINFII